MPRILKIVIVDVLSSEFFIACLLLHIVYKTEIKEKIRIYEDNRYYVRNGSNNNNTDNT